MPDPGDLARRRRLIRREFAQQAVGRRVNLHQRAIGRLDELLRRAHVKKLQEGGYLIQSRSSDDRRTVRLKLTPSGKAVRNRVAELFEKQAGALEPTASVRTDDLEQLNKSLARLERFWSDQIRYQM